MGKCSPKNPFKNSWVHSWQNLWKFLDATKRKIPVLRNLESKSKFWKPKPLACGLALMSLQISSLVEPQVFSQNSDGFKISSPDVSLKTVSGASALYFWGSMSMWLFAWIVGISHRVHLQWSFLYSVQNNKPHLSHLLSFIFPSNKLYPFVIRTSFKSHRLYILTPLISLINIIHCWYL